MVRQHGGPFQEGMISIMVALCGLGGVRDTELRPFEVHLDEYVEDIKKRIAGQCGVDTRSFYLERMLPGREPPCYYVYAPCKLVVRDIPRPRGVNLIVFRTRPEPREHDKWWKRTGGGQVGGSSSSTACFR